MTPYQEVISYVKNTIIDFHKKQDSETWTIDFDEIPEKRRKKFTALFLEYITTSSTNHRWEWLIESDFSEKVFCNFIATLQSSNKFKESEIFLESIVNCSIKYFERRFQDLIEDQIGETRTAYYQALNENETYRNG